jgi:hypothetical protein
MFSAIVRRCPREKGNGTEPRPSPTTDGLEYNEERNDNNEDFVAEVGSHDSYDSRKQQNKNNAHNGEDSWREHVEPQSFISEALPHFSDARWLSTPEVLETIRRQLGVANRVLDVAVAQVSLQCPREFGH